jgi:tagatose 6-phosphate kinase
MITTVTLNPAIDITYYINDFHGKGMHRIQKIYKEPGGKGINVAKVIRALGIPVTTTGFIGGYNGRWIKDKLDQLHLKNEFERVMAESRLCLNILDDKTLNETELLELGPTISSIEYNRLKNRLEILSKKSKFVSFSGSLPSGLENDTYAELIELVQRNGAKAVLDTSGVPLKSALASKPFMIKPNRSELASLLDQSEISEEEILKVMREWHETGIACTVVSLGSDGFIANIKGQYLKVIPPKIQPVNTVGCGDTLVAALMAGVYRGKETQEYLCEGAAAAATNALEERAGVISLETMNQLREKVQIVYLS